MDSPLHSHSLRILGSPGAVFRVTDGASKCVGTGMYQLNLELPQGIYTVSAMFGNSIETRQVLLDRPQSIELQPEILSFGDRAFSLAPEVMVALKPHKFCPGGQLIALRGPWRDERAAEDRVMLYRDGIVVPAVQEGVVHGLQGQGVWSWQLFNLAPEQQLPTDAPGIFSVTRSVCDMAQSTEPGASDSNQTQSPQKVSHVLPHWGDWVVWAAYPATTCGAPVGANLPLSYYLRLRLTLPNAVPVLCLQSLSDQVFTALAERTGLPLSEPVLDLLLSAEADPLLVLGAAHLASITLGWSGRFPQLPQLPHDASPTKNQNGAGELQSIDIDALHKRFKDWLGRHNEGSLASSTDMVAVRFLFGLDTHAHLRVPPVLLRSLDGLFAEKALHETRSASSQEAQSVGNTYDDRVWGMRMQISDSFAFLQWLPDADYQELLHASMKLSLENVTAMRSTEREIKKVIAQIEQEKQNASKNKTAQHSLSGRHAAPRSLAKSSIPETQANPPSLDLEAFIKSSATSLRIPASAMPQFSIALNNLNIDEKSSIEPMLQQWAGRLPDKQD